MPGHSDGLGDRLLMFDNTGAASYELLRFKKEFSDRPGFESALRDRIRKLDGFTHPSIARVRAVKWLDDNNGLALISDSVSGRRLSEVLSEARGPGFALDLIRQLTPALVALQQQGEGVAHGLLTPEKIIVTPGGHLVLVEHVLGPAVEMLGLSPSRLRGEFGLAVPTGSNGHGQQFNERADVVQLGLIALSLTLGRRVDPRDYPHNVSTLLDDFPRIAGRGSSSAPQLRMRQLRQPLLQIGLERREPGFGTLEAAQREIRGRHARFAERRRLLAQLLDRLRVHLPQLRPFVLDRPLELTNALQRILLQALLDRAPVVELAFELLDRIAVPLVVLGPAIENLGTALGERRETLLHRQQRVLRLSPLTKSKAQLIDLSL